MTDFSRDFWINAGKGHKNRLRIISRLSKNIQAFWNYNLFIFDSAFQPSFIGLDSGSVADHKCKIRRFARGAGLKMYHQLISSCFSSIFTPVKIPPAPIHTHMWQPAGSCGSSCPHLLLWPFFPNLCLYCRLAPSVRSLLHTGPALYSTAPPCRTRTQLSFYEIPVLDFLEHDWPPCGVDRGTILCAATSLNPFWNIHSETAGAFYSTSNPKEKHAVDASPKKKPKKQRKQVRKGWNESKYLWAKYTHIYLLCL